jgi:predicted amidohydrolase
VFPSSSPRVRHWQTAPGSGFQGDNDGRGAHILFPTRCISSVVLLWDSRRRCCHYGGVHDESEAVGLGALRIAAAQPRCTASDVAANARSHAEIVRAAAARVVVFPELSLTGYELDAPPVDPADDRLLALSEACSTTGSIALAGAPTVDDDGDHISVLAVTESGVEVAYNKMWSSETEAQRFVPGREAAVLDVDGWQLGLAICKDTGITEHASATAALGMDVYVACVLDSADDAAVHESRAHRIAAIHHVWVVVASFAGSTGGGYEAAAAQSRIWSPDGCLLASAGRDTRPHRGEKAVEVCAAPGVEDDVGLLRRVLDRGGPVVDDGVRAEADEEGRGWLPMRWRPRGHRRLVRAAPRRGRRLPRRRGSGLVGRRRARPARRGSAMR